MAKLTHDTKQCVKETRICTEMKSSRTKLVNEVMTWISDARTRWINLQLISITKKAPLIVQLVAV